MKDFSGDKILRSRKWIWLLPHWNPVMRGGGGTLHLVGVTLCWSEAACWSPTPESLQRFKLKHWRARLLESGSNMIPIYVWSSRGLGGWWGGWCPRAEASSCRQSSSETDTNMIIPKIWKNFHIYIWNTCTVYCARITWHAGTWRFSQAHKNNKSKAQQKCKPVQLSTTE